MKGVHYTVSYAFFQDTTGTSGNIPLVPIDQLMKFDIAWVALQPANLAEQYIVRMGCSDHGPISDWHHGFQRFGRHYHVGRCGGRRHSKSVLERRNMQWHY
jgi:hypothetical protein